MVGRGELHFLYSNHNFIKENEAIGYRVFARPKEDPGKGQIVVLEELSDSLAGRPAGTGRWSSRTRPRSWDITFPWTLSSASGSKSSRTSPAIRKARWDS